MKTEVIIGNIGKQCEEMTDLEKRIIEVGYGEIGEGNGR